jgi:hypothetical protein
LVATKAASCVDLDVDEVDRFRELPTADLGAGAVPRDVWEEQRAVERATLPRSR